MKLKAWLLVLTAIRMAAAFWHAKQMAHATGCRPLLLSGPTRRLGQTTRRLSERETQVSLRVQRALLRNTRLSAGNSCVSASRSAPADIAVKSQMLLRVHYDNNIPSDNGVEDIKRQHQKMYENRSIVQSADRPAATARRSQQQLFRHRFLVCDDMVHRSPCELTVHTPGTHFLQVIRLPLETISQLRAFVTATPLTGCVHAQVEAFRPLHKMQWSMGSRRMLSAPNAGGSSVLSEALSLEVLSRAFGAVLRKTEMELKYTAGSKITDFAISVFGESMVGVSVTRAFKWPEGQPSEDELYSLLLRKLAGINASSRNVRNFDWSKQLLHVWARSHRDARALERQFDVLPAEVKTNTIVVIIIGNGVDWIW